MSDADETPEGVAEAEQSTVEGTNESTTPAPWGDDFNADRAWNTIQHLRGREKELETEAQRFRALKSDPEQFATLAQELGYEFEQPEADDDVFTDDSEDPYAHVNERLERFEQWQQQQEIEKQAVQISGQIDSLTADHDLSLRDKQVIFRDAIDNGGTPAAIKAATEQHIAYLEEAGKRYQSQYLKSKKASPKPPTGKPGEPAFDPRDTKSRVDRIASLAEAMDD